MNGRYYRTCSDDIRTSQGWFKNVLLLGLLNFVPVFGQMSVAGYAYEWAHKAAWRFPSPMPYKIYGRANSKMLRWGWFAIVVTVVFAIVPYLISALGGAISGAAEVPAYYGMHGHSSAVDVGSVLGLALGGIVQFVGWVAAIFAGILSWVAMIRVTMYNRLGTGFQFKQVWKMAKHDFGGLMRVFGMSLAVGAVICILSVLLFGITGAIGGIGAVLAFLGSYGAHAGMSWPLGAAQIVMLGLTVLPLLLIDAYIVSCMCVYAQLLVTRGVGYWCAQFDVARWGTKDDPLPFEREEAGTGEPERPHAEDDEDTGADDAGAHADSGAGTAASAEGGEERPRSTGPVGWRAAGTSAADRDD